MNRRPRILLVDDSPTVRAALMAMLKDEFEVHTACDGLDGLARTALVRPDLILLDVQMPVLDGRATCKALRADEASRDLPIILVTALVGEEDVEQGYGCGATDYVCKPVHKEELLAKVHGWLGARRLADRS